MHVSETFGLTHRKTYVIKPNENTQNIFVKEDYMQYKSLAKIFVAIFLPHGYPESVSKDYLQYQIWDSIQAFASSITGGLCTHAILKGVGVGNENASHIAATVTWLLKDGTYMIGKIGFAWLKGTKLDSECKKWRLFADIINDAAMFLDLLSGYFQDYFLPIVCISGILKSTVGVAGGCTRAALTQHQARKNNMADVSAKDGSQETLVNLLALLCNLVLIPLISENHLFIWCLFIIMTFVHLIANYLAVKSVVMETFNEERFQIYANHYFKEGIEKKNYLSVDDVNKKENVLFFNFSTSIPIKLGASFSNVIQGRRYEEIQQILDIYKNCNYILSFSQQNSKGSINVVFNKKATTETYLEALFQACYAIHLLQNTSTLYNDNKNSTSLEAATREFTTKMFQNYLNSLKIMQFKTNLVVFDVDLWQADW